MLLKVPLEKCIVIKINKLNKESILLNDAFKICSGCVDQYIITEDNRLFGMISSFDLERAVKKEKDFDIYSIINRHPIVINQSDRFEKIQAKSIFQKSYCIRSIPVVNESREIQYIYTKVNKPLHMFVKQNFLNNIIQYENRIKTQILEMEKMYPYLSIKILSDFNLYGLELSEIKEYCINEDRIPYLNPDKNFVLLVYLYDFNCMKIINKLIHYGIKFSGSNFTGKDIVAEVTPYFKIDEAAKDVLEEESYYNGNYFDLNDFGNIFQALHMTKNLKGCYVEIGTYRGDSARAALSYMKRSNITKLAYFLDTYEGFNYPEAEHSSDFIWANSHDDTSIDFVENRLKEFTNYQLIKANIITDAFPEKINDIAVCNIDVDMYEAIDAALNKVYKRILQGGIIIAEDFGHTPDLFGAQYAILKFISSHEDEFYGIYLQSGQYLMIKK